MDMQSCVLYACFRDGRAFVPLAGRFRAVYELMLVVFASRACWPNNLLGPCSEENSK